MRLRIVTWNCNMALHEKHERLLELQPDLAIIPECAEPAVLRRKAPDFRYASCEWRGVNDRHKGLGVFSFGDLQLRLHSSWNPALPLFLPVEVRGWVALNLLAVWALDPRSSPASAVPNSWTLGAAGEYYAPFLSERPSVAAGDFNANVRWDRVRRRTPFTAVDGALRQIGLASAYHAVRGDALGEEVVPTLYHMRDPDRPFHVDYIYLPTLWQHTIQECHIGRPADWLALSDHMPLLVDCDPLHGSA